jgi:hypothetical protein
LPEFRSQSVCWQVGFEKRVFAGKIEFVFAGKDGRVVLRQRDFDQFVVLRRAEQDAYRRVFVRQFFIAVEIIDIHLQLPKL